MRIVSDKEVYGGMLTDKYYLVFEDGTSVQVSLIDWDTYDIGDEYKDIEE